MAPINTCLQFCKIVPFIHQGPSPVKYEIKNQNIEGMIVGIFPCRYMSIVSIVGFLEMVKPPSILPCVLHTMHLWIYQHLSLHQTRHDHNSRNYDSLVPRQLCLQGGYACRISMLNKAQFGVYVAMQCVPCSLIQNVLLSVYLQGASYQNPS